MNSIKYIPDKRFKRFRVVYDLIKHRPFFLETRVKTRIPKCCKCLEQTMFLWFIMTDPSFIFRAVSSLTFECMNVLIYPVMHRVSCILALSIAAATGFSRGCRDVVR
jgi:hypothetical protein